jgi:uncharacterized protein (DUF111 family)
VDHFGPLDGVAVERIGYGAGTKQFQNFPNCLRLLLCDEGKVVEAPIEATTPGDAIVVIEANIDDMTAQNFAYVTDRLLEAGALDVCTIPIQMKKGRPGHMLQALAPSNRWEVIRRLIFEETTSIGVRHYTAQRSALERELVHVETSLGKITIKLSKLDGRVVSSTPEYEDCARIAREQGMPLKDVQALAVKAYQLPS